MSAREVIDEWAAHSSLQDLRIHVLEQENLELRQLAFEFWLELFAQTKERIRADQGNAENVP